MEPVAGLEPATRALRMRCSTTELHRRARPAKQQGIHNRQIHLSMQARIPEVIYEFPAQTGGIMLDCRMRFGFSVFLMVFVMWCLPTTAMALERFEGCVLVPTDWADGDSFLVRLPDDRKITVRLYAVDCIEIHLSGDDSNARRLRDQRRYFGIQDSIAAIRHGEAAWQFVQQVLAEPFVLHTAFADGRGDGRFQRVYGFITTADGRDLGEALVTAGLARAYGVRRATPDGRSAREYEAGLNDLELTAARKGKGAWADTDWSRIADDRRSARAEEEEIRAIQGRADLIAPINPNTAARDDLMRLPSVGEVTANRIIETREKGRFSRPEDLLEVPGIGRATLEKILPYLDFNPADAPAP